MQGGWTYVIGSPKWHYIIGHMSLCGNWLIMGNPELEQGKDKSPDNCKSCMKKLEKLKLKEGK